MDFQLSLEPDLSICRPPILVFTEGLRKGDIVVDFLHVIAIVEHVKESLE
jgi:hypothetical protein